MGQVSFGVMDTDRSSRSYNQNIKGITGADTDAEAGTDEI